MKRALPWLLAAMAYIGPPTWAYFAIKRDYADQRASHGWACGTPALGMMLLACIVSGLLSIFATGVRGLAVGWWRDASLAATGGEMAALIFPFVGAIGFVAW